MAQGHSGWHMAFQVRGGIDRLILDMFLRPNLARKFIAKIAKACLGFIKIMIDCSVEVIFVTDDYADSYGPLMTPKQFREFELPNLRRVIELGRKHGIPILKHTDENIYPILEDMIEAGISSIHPMYRRGGWRRRFYLGFKQFSPC